MNRFQEWVSRKDYPVVAEIEALVTNFTTILLEAEGGGSDRYQAALKQIYQQTSQKWQQMINRLKAQIKDTLTGVGAPSGYQTPWGGQVPVQQTTGARGIDTSTQASSFARRQQPKGFLGRIGSMFSHFDPKLSKDLKELEELFEYGFAPSAGGKGMGRRMGSPASGGWQTLPSVDAMYDKLLQFMKDDLKTAMQQAYKAGKLTMQAAVPPPPPEATIPADQGDEEAAA